MVAVGGVIGAYTATSTDIASLVDLVAGHQLALYAFNRCFDAGAALHDQRNFVREVVRPAEHVYGFGDY